MSKPNSNLYDVVIIGAGIGGLVCGCYLAKAGMKVLIAEQHSKPGGYCTSFKRRGFSFDAAAHSFGSYRKNGNMFRIINELGLKIKIEKYDPSDIIVTPDYRISLWGETAKTIRGLQNIFPHQSQEIESFFHFLTNSQPLDLIMLRKQTLRDLLDRYFVDDQLKSILSFPILGNGGLPPSLISAFTAIKIYTEFLLDGGYYPDESMQSLPDALANKFKMLGGDLCLSSSVRKIEVKDNSVTGVMLGKNVFIPSRYVVSNCDAKQTYLKLLGKRVVKKEFLNRLNTMVESLSVFVAYLGIDRHFDALPKPGVNYWVMSHYNIEQMYLSFKKGNLNKFDGYMVRLSPNKKSLQAFINAPYKNQRYWIKNKYMLLEEFMKKIEQLIPGLSKHISYEDAATPYTMFRYTLNYHGAAYGWASMLSQIAEPEFKKPSFIQGLFLVGHWSSHAQGIPGVAHLGLDMAKSILRRDKYVANG